MIKITSSAAELIPTVQYGNITVGPVAATRFVRDLDDDEHLKAEIRRVQAVVEEIVAEDRQTVAVLMRSRADRP